MERRFIYGTAWKKDRTADLVVTAARAGFRAVDTANQPKHYDEPLVGEALASLAAAGLGREAFFVQTKFTLVPGHDHRVPYDVRADPGTQVRQSFDSSLQHLRTDYVDAYLLHGPSSFPGLEREDWEVWAAIEALHRSGRARAIGISNVNAQQVRLLAERAEIPPAIVQNRCYASRGWDREVRAVCRARGIAYQGFSLLTANPGVVRHARVASIARRLGVEPPQVIFRFAMQAGMVPLTGTTSERHMREDLRALEIELTPGEVQFIESIAG